MQAITFQQLRKLIPFDSCHAQRGNHPRIASLCRALMRMDYSDRAWLIYDEFGLLSIAVGACEQEALDNVCDADGMTSCLVEYDDLDAEQIEQSESEGYVSDLTRLGNAGELHDLQYVSIREWQHYQVRI
jgi:hypothetical protein